MITSRTNSFIRSISPYTWLQRYNNPYSIRDKIQQKESAAEKVRGYFEAAVQRDDTHFQQICAVVVGQIRGDIARLQRRQERAIAKSTSVL